MVGQLIKDVDLRTMQTVFMQRRKLALDDLYEAPFTNFGMGAVEKLFKQDDIANIIEFTNYLSLYSAYIMDAQLQSISKIFTEKLYRIPDYQRGYAWTEKQLKDFWSDILSLEEGKNHYVGVLTLEKVPNDIYKGWEEDNWIITAKNFEPFYVVDGQQRLTTTIILIQAISEVVQQTGTLNYNTPAEVRKKFIFDSKDNGLSRSYIFGYEKDNPSYEFLKTKIFLENSASAYRHEETIYTHNLEYAKEFFGQRIKDLTPHELEDIYRKVTQHLLFNIYSIDSDIDVFVAFESMNNRGKPLSNLELLKNRLIYLSTRFPIEDSDKKALRKKINDSWKCIYHYLGKNKENPLDDDFFLLNHFLLYFGKNHPIHGDILRRRRSLHSYHGVYESFLLEDKFSLKKITAQGKERLEVQDIYEYVESLQTSVEMWFTLFNPELVNEFDDIEKLYLNRLNRIGMRHFGLIILASFQRERNRNIRKRLLDLLEQYSFLSMLSTFHYVMPIAELHDSAIAIAQKEISVNEFIRKLKEYILRVHSRPDFLEDLTKKFKHEGYYEWSGIKYFLFEYEYSLKGSSKAKKQKIDWQTFSEEMDDFLTVEHIYPQRATDECWKRNFNMYSATQRKVLANSLGNLLPLSKPKNSSLQNICFENKIDTERGTIGYRYGSYSENKVAKEKSWTPLSILNRGIALLEFVEKRWNIPLGDKQRKITLLNLDFIKEPQV